MIKKNKELEIQLRATESKNRKLYSSFIFQTNWTETGLFLALALCHCNLRLSHNYALIELQKAANFLFGTHCSGCSINSFSFLPFKIDYSLENKLENVLMNTALLSVPALSEEKGADRRCRNPKKQMISKGSISDFTLTSRRVRIFFVQIIQMLNKSKQRFPKPNNFRSKIINHEAARRTFVWAITLIRVLHSIIISKFMLFNTIQKQREAIMRRKICFTLSQNK